MFNFLFGPDHEKSILKKIHLYCLENICTVYVQENDVKVEITEVKGNFQRLKMRSLTFEKPVLIFPHFIRINYTNDRLNERKFQINIY